MQDPPSSEGERDLTSTLASYAAEALYLMDAEGRVTFMNPAAERMFGWSLEETLGKRLHDQIHHTRPNGEPFPMSDCPLGNVMRTGEAVINHEDLFIHKSGALIPVSCSNAPVMVNGVITGAVLVVHDLTQRKLLEDALQRRADDFAELDRRKDDFIAMLAHELRNPLAAVSNAVQLLRLDRADAQVRQRAIEVVDRQIRHQARLIDDLLDVSRVQRNQIRLQLTRLDLARVVATEAEDRRAPLAQAGLSLTLELPPRPLWIQGDATRLAQVIGNLLGNAGKFTEPGGAISVSARAVGGAAEVVVRDTGAGITPEFLPHIFEPFTQADRSLDRRLGGLGLGLALVKGLVEMHGGSVRAHSEGVGRGAEITFCLPLEADAPETQSAPPAPSREAPLADRPLRVLVIEDNEDGAEMLRELLELRGHEVQVASCGPTGVEAAHRFLPDVVLCDIGLPGMDGYAVARALRSAPDTTSMKLIAVTGYGQESDRARSLEAGFDVHLTKPVHPDALARTLAGVRPR